MGGDLTKIKISRWLLEAFTQKACFDALVKSSQGFYERFAKIRGLQRLCGGFARKVQRVKGTFTHHHAGFVRHFQGLAPR